MIIRPLLLVLFVLFGLIEWAAAYSRLPDVMATNFGGSGWPGGWMSKPAASWTMNLMMAGAAGIFMLPGWLLRLTPTGMMNLPNRDYWLAPERRAATVRRLETRVWQMGLLTVVFLVFVNHLLIAANLLPEPRLSAAFLPVFVSYMTLVGVWTVGLMLAFRRPGVER